MSEETSEARLTRLERIEKAAQDLEQAEEYLAALEATRSPIDQIAAASNKAGEAWDALKTALATPGYRPTRQSSESKEGP